VIRKLLSIEKESAILVANEIQLARSCVVSRKRTRGVSMSSTMIKCFR